ncbi:hypothetical protein LTS18_003703 [Coniosporium uncinatum]|uniref:Uncharacterized protein n=1 Tax=Coniosporium uncinatum TaxID=93489 RepID=A0ACC3D6U6_9PEZI|nr:hypothetical protein LTS18_003703 [Coniosporium uncinatum]
MSTADFDRLLTVAACRILERNELVFAPSELTTTQSIDTELLKVAKSMPGSFWRPIYYSGLTPGEPDTFLETLRLESHVYYYGLLLQLHLPYMIRTDDNTEHEYSKITCVNAGREISTRFMAHRTFNPVSSCSRPVDFFALLVAMTLLLAHLDAQHHQEATNFLAHQRLSDRALLVQVLERMDVLSNIYADSITEKSARLVRRLLDIEADAAEGSTYTARSLTRNDSVQEGEGEGEELRLHIPYLGIVKIARQGPVSRESLQGRIVSRPDRPSQLEHGRAPFAASNDECLSLLNTSPSNTQPLGHLIDVVPGSTFPESLLAPEPPNEQLQAPGHDLTMLLHPSSDPGEISLQTAAGLSPLAASVDDWTFQGVDTAFFDSLMRGSFCVDTAGMEQELIDDSLSSSRT